MTKLTRAMMLTIAVTALLFSTACASTTRDNAVNDAKSALVLSAHLYDEAMHWTGDLYRAGSCNEDCKARALQIANVYLTSARAMKSALDVGGSFLSNYNDIYSAIDELTTLLQSKGAAVRPNTLPRPESLRGSVELSWPPGNSPHRLTIADVVALHRKWPTFVESATPTWIGGAR